MEKFLSSIQNELKSETQLTENGATGYATSGKCLLDMNFKLSSYRSMGEDDIIADFAKAYAEDPLLAVKFMFFAGDVRGGAGERRVFRTCLKWLATMNPAWAEAIVKLVPEYNRWDSLFSLIGTPAEKKALACVFAQLSQDMVDRVNSKPISLLAKWMPSINTSSKETCRLAKFLCKALGKTEKQYRKVLSDLRAYIKVIETRMSANQWGDIDYQAVPSRANVIYRNAFLRHDAERRLAFLESLEKGEAKINASVSAPHEIVHAYFTAGEYWREHLHDQDQTLEALWKALPDYVRGNGSSIAVVDGSGSMGSSIGSTSITAHDVARGLGLYFAERLSGPFKDKYITFSENPRLVDFGKLKTLHERLELAQHYDECENTNIEAVFELILKTAVDNHLEQKDLPSNIVVISDMEFDYGVDIGASSQEALFKAIANAYKAMGYKLARLVFWNVNSRTCTVPLQENECGVALVSGFTPAIVKMVLSGKLDPFEVLKETLDSERYRPVEDAIRALGR